jgi:hypothetical protein
MRHSDRALVKRSARELGITLTVIPSGDNRAGISVEVRSGLEAAYRQVPARVEVAPWQVRPV